MNLAQGYSYDTKHGKVLHHCVHCTVLDYMLTTLLVKDDGTKYQHNCPEAFKCHRVKVILLFSQSSLLSYFVSWLLG